MHVAWLGSFSQRLQFLTISPNLHDIWPIFFLIPSRYETAHFLIVLRLSGDGYSLQGSKKQPSRHMCVIKMCSVLTEIIEYAVKSSSQNKNFKSYVVILSRLEGWKKLKRKIPYLGIFKYEFNIQKNCLQRPLPVCLSIHAKHHKLFGAIF